MPQLSILDLTKLCLQHGYRTMPTSEQALRDCEALEKEGVDASKLLHLASLIEQQELRCQKRKDKEVTWALSLPDD